MRCRQAEKGLSDSLDGPLSAEKRAAIVRHEENCPRCRAFKEKALRLNREFKTLEEQVRPEFDSRAFTTRLKGRLASASDRKRSRISPLHVLKKKWGYATAGCLLAAGVLLVMVLSREPGFTAEEQIVLSLDSAVSEIYREIGDDPVLEEAFHSLVLASIYEALESGASGELFYLEPALSSEASFTAEEWDELEVEVEKKEKT